MAWTFFFSGGHLDLWRMQSDWYFHTKPSAFISDGVSGDVYYGGASYSMRCSDFKSASSETADVYMYGFRIGSCRSGVFAAFGYCGIISDDVSVSCVDSVGFFNLCGICAVRSFLLSKPVCGAFSLSGLCAGGIFHSGGSELLFTYAAGTDLLFLSGGCADFYRDHVCSLRIFCAVQLSGSCEKPPALL